jgi:uncharacterized protein (DUF488 family)
MSTDAIEICTIGFTKKTAPQFFEKLREAHVRRVVDVRLNNTSHLAGFSKMGDLEYFLQNVLHAGYVHLPILAPTQEMLDAYKKNKGSWEQYEKDFLALMQSREIEKNIPREVVDHGCLLCSEDQPHHCHRRLVAEYLRAKWGSVEIKHLG